MGIVAFEGEAGRLGLWVSRGPAAAVFQVLSCQQG